MADGRGRGRGGRGGRGGSRGGRGGRGGSSRGGRGRGGSRGGRGGRREERHEQAPEVLADARFAQAARDPKFRTITEREKKVGVDARFERMLTDRAFRSRKTVDMFGRPLSARERDEDLSKFYRRGGGRARRGADGEYSSGDEDSDEAEEEDSAAGSDGHESEEDEENAAEAAAAAEEEEEEGSSSEGEQAVLEEGQETARLAAVDMDWNALSATDILAMLAGFTPKTGAIRRVTVVPSEYGKQRIADEDLNGPPKEIFNPAPEGANNDSASGSAGADGDDSDGAGAAVAAGGDSDDDDDDMDEDEELDEDAEMEKYSKMDVKELEALLAKEEARANKRRNKNKKSKKTGEDDNDKNEDNEDNDDEEEEEEEEFDEKAMMEEEIEKELAAQQERLKAQYQAEDEVFNQEALRKYERQRMRYYYAVIECDSRETAVQLYDACDGLEVGNTSITFNLQFIPDDVAIDYAAARDSATEVPPNYKPGSVSHGVGTISLDHTKVKLSWDETPASRRQLLRQDFRTLDEQNDDDFKAYLASDSSSDSDADSSASEVDDDAADAADGSAEDARAARLRRKQQRIRRKYEALLGSMGADGAGADADGDSDAAAGSDGETMQITFTPGLGDVADGVLRRREEEQARAREAAKSPWQKYLDKRKEKIAEKRRARKARENGEDVDVDEDADEDAAEDTTTTKKGKTGGKKMMDAEERAAAEAKAARDKAELELLLIDEKDAAGAARAATLEEEEEEGDGEEGAHGKKRGRGGRPFRESKKAKRAREELEEDADALGTRDFVVDTSDSRFAGLYASGDFAPDPTNPEFRKTKSMDAILQQRARVRAAQRDREEEEAIARARQARAQVAAGAAAAADGEEGSVPLAAKHAEMALLAQSLKAKAQAKKAAK